MLRNSKIYVAGHNGLVGSAIVHALTKAGYENILTRARNKLDLIDSTAVNVFFGLERPDYVFLAAAKVGGILANKTYPADFIRENLMIELNVIEAARTYGVKKLIFLGSSCIYPKHAPQPIKEEFLLTAALEESNRAYALAKISGIELCRSYRTQFGSNFICVMPTNLYGPNDNFHPENSHVLPGLMRRFHEAKINHLPEVTVWGTGTPRREFLHVNDLADACIFLMEQYDKAEIVNIGTGEDISIRELADLLKKIVGYSGSIVWDTSKPDGTPQKLLDTSKLAAIGWKYNIRLVDGVRDTYAWYQNQEIK